MASSFDSGLSEIDYVTHVLESRSVKRARAAATWWGRGPGQQLRAAASSRLPCAT